MLIIFDCSKAYVWMALKKVSFIALALKPEYLPRSRSNDFCQILGGRPSEYVLSNV